MSPRPFSLGAFSPSVSSGGVVAWLDGPLSSERNLERDEELLREGGPAVRVAVLSDRAVSVGVGQRPHDRVYETARREGIPVVRRTTGGTGVLHLPGDLAWSVVLPRTHPKVGVGYVRNYGRLGEGVVRALSRHGVRSEWSEAFALSDTFCFFGPRGKVLSVGGRALGGAAQHLARDSLLHQGVVGREVERDLLHRVFEVPRPLLRDRLVSLQELGALGSPTALAVELLEALESSVGSV